ncbi:hypothetical protein [Thermodesulfovibrio sp. 3462-1]|jgi:hypothetical protein|uniref:Uncharacterized protein n=2 Tax=Thermodesulfovibrio TaxID=28261 RepID=A0A2J6WQ40_9BACT|nr:MAG: hypothetical protein C0186_00870 [Thermodesulfovibrio aggregans]
MVRKKVYLLVLMAAMITVLIMGYAVAQNKEFKAVSSHEKTDYCPVSQGDTQKDVLKIAVKPCTPSGWWCTSNSQCCSGKCTNNVCD